jgi:hypothetical protein
MKTGHNAVFHAYFAFTHPLYHVHDMLSALMSV